MRRGQAHRRPQSRKSIRLATSRPFSSGRAPSVIRRKPIPTRCGCRRHRRPTKPIGARYLTLLLVLVWNSILHSEAGAFESEVGIHLPSLQGTSNLPCRWRNHVRDSWWNAGSRAPLFDRALRMSNLAVQFPAKAQRRSAVMRRSVLASKQRELNASGSRGTISDKSPANNFACV